MRKSYALIDLSSNVSITERKESYIDSQFRWRSIKNFIYLACTSTSSPYNLDIFSKVWQNVRIFDFILFEAFVGIPYMFMDCFIKQYTRKIDCNKNLSPLLRGISYGLFLQTALWTLINAAFLADCIRFFILSLREVTPMWARSIKCQTKENTSSCVPSHELIYRCKRNTTTAFQTTCAFHHYEKNYLNVHLDRNVMTARFFVMAVVWIGIFFCTSITEEALLKFFKLVFIVRSCSSLITIISLVVSARDEAYLSISQMLDISLPHSYTLSMDHVCYSYGIGFLGLYDLGSLSPYIMVDNAVVVFMVVYTLMTFVRSWTFRILYTALTKCVTLETISSPHKVFFAVMPLATEMFSAQKFYVYIIYVNMVLASVTYVTMLLLTMSKFLQNEFSSIKQIYIVGMLCTFGVALSLAVAASITESRVAGVMLGLNIALLYLGGSKAMFVMWVYGVRRFSTDIQFWLGFKPTKFWSFSWLMLPVILFGFMIYRIFRDLVNEARFQEMKLIETYFWIGLTLLVVLFFKIKTLVGHLASNNLAGLFRASTKYGSFDPDDRKKRMVYNEISSIRKCQHNCMLLDEMIDCYHLPLSTKSSSLTDSSSSASTLNIFEASTSAAHRSVNPVIVDYKMD